MIRRAMFSDDGKYRFRLTRDWSNELFVSETRLITWIMANPSVADTDRDDNTITKCMNLSRRWGFQRLEVVNLCPFVSTDPKPAYGGRFWLPADVREANNAEILRSAYADQVMVAWGAVGEPFLEIDGVREVLGRVAERRELLCLGTTQSGQPKHPLARGAHHVPMDVQPARWEWSL